MILVVSSNESLGTVACQRPAVMRDVEEEEDDDDDPGLKWAAEQQQSNSRATAEDTMSLSRVLVRFRVSLRLCLLIFLNRRLHPTLLPPPLPRLPLHPHLNNNHSFS